jgi:serine/threonine protein kinase
MSEPRRITERYRLEKRVSSKDSGSVFRAVDTRSGETVTVKLINAGDSEEQRELFESHLAALGEVRHPALPRILDFGFTTAGSAFLITEHLEGSDLTELADASPERILTLLIQLAEGLEAVTAQGLALRNLSLENLRVVPAPDGEQVKILGLGTAAFLAGAPDGSEGPDGYSGDRRSFAELALRALHLSAQESRGTVSVALPLQVAGSLQEPERLREVLEGILRGDPEGHFSTWGAIGRTLRTALLGGTGRQPHARTVPIPSPSAGGTAQIPLNAPLNKAWEEVRLGGSAPAPLLARSGGPGSLDGGEGHDTTMALERLGPSPAAEPPAPPPVPISGTMILSAVPAETVPGASVAPTARDFATRVLRPEELEPPASPDASDRTTQVVPPPPPSPSLPPPPPAVGGGTVRIERSQLEGSDARRGTVRIPLRDLEEPAAPAAPPLPTAPLAGTLRFPAPAPPPRPVDETEDTQPQVRRTFPAPVPPPPPASPAAVEPPAPPAPEPPRAAPPAVPPPIPKPVPAPPVQALSPVDLPPIPKPGRQPVPPPPVRAPSIEPSAAAVPEPAAVTPPAAVPAPQPAPPRRKSDGKGLRMALLIGVPAAVLLVAVVGWVAWMSRRSAEPEPPPVQVQQAPKPVPRPVQQVPQQPRPVNAQIVLAEGFLTSGDLPGAKTALEAIPPEQMALFTSEEQERYQSALDALTPLQSQAWGASLTRGLSGGDLRLLRAAVASPPDAATLTPEQKKELVRARKILDLDGRLSKAQRARNHSDSLRQAGLLLAELPRSSRALQARKQAGDALLAEADAQAGQLQFDAALVTLQRLQEGWPEHPDVRERIERLRAERKADDQMEAVLAAVTRAERADRPRDGLQALAGTRPNERYADRFRQARERLEAQLVQLDRNPPQISAPGVSEMAFEKGATVIIPLRITDDLEVASTEAWARPEGGRFTRVNVRSAGGSSYEIEISPDLHQNKSIDFYVKATDSSGHEGTLGSVQRPEKVKRKKWFSKIRGGKEGDGEE